MAGHHLSIKWLQHLLLKGPNTSRPFFIWIEAIRIEGAVEKCRVQFPLHMWRLWQWDRAASTYWYHLTLTLLWCLSFCLSAVYREDGWEWVCRSNEHQRCKTLQHLPAQRYHLSQKSYTVEKIKTLLLHYIYWQYTRVQVGFSCDLSLFYSEWDELNCDFDLKLHWPSSTWTSTSGVPCHIHANIQQ